MNTNWIKLDNAAKAFSLVESKNNNIFRFSAILKDKIDVNFLKCALKKTLDFYPIFKVKLRKGFFWKYLKQNEKLPIIEKENEFFCQSKSFKRNNNFLLKITYFNKKINMEMFHILTDGVGAKKFFVDFLYNYLDLKYNLNYSEKNKINSFKVDEYLKNANKKLRFKKQNKKAFFIKEKYINNKNKTYHFIMNLKKFKSICKEYKVSLTEFLTTIYILSIYNTIYDKKTNKDIIITVPIDLRKYYEVETLSNFFTCMYINGNVVKDDEIIFEKILNHVHNDYKNKLVKEKVDTYLSRDVKLGTNIFLKLIPLSIKKFFMKYFCSMFCQNSTATLSNIGIIDVIDEYKNYIENIFVLVKVEKKQKTKCTICSYNNNLTVTLTSNLYSEKFENEFYKLLKKYISEVKLIKEIY